ncbi:MAG: disulfide reductase [Dehalococcoidia bacterium]|nr:MAG: disulfide reductase [Dehalococcoidia bacterium]
MKVSYYPGCSLKGTAREYGESVEAVFRHLGMELDELADWNCCGASSAHAVSDELAVGLGLRNLEIADRTGFDLVVPCAACFQRLKVAEKAVKSGKVKPQNGYRGAFRIRHLADFLGEDISPKLVKERVKKPLEGLKVVCYYGCLTSRPPEITDAARPEDPETMDNLMTLLGADVENWSYKTDCCGGNLILTRPKVAKKMVQKLFDKALEAGADAIVVACPMCFSNLDMKQAELTRETGREYHLPILYLSELLGLAFGDRDTGKWLRGHEVDPRPLLKEKGLL